MKDSIVEEIETTEELDDDLVVQFAEQVESLYAEDKRLQDMSRRACWLGCSSYYLRQAEELAADEEEEDEEQEEVEEA